MYPSDKDKQYFFQLLTRYNHGKASPEEIIFVERYLQVLEHRPAPASGDLGEVERNIKNQLLQHLDAPARIRSLQPRKWWAAAAVALLLAGSSYFLFRVQQPTRPVTIAKDILPGHNGAILTLAGGKMILLDSLGNGQVAMQGQTTVRLQNGQLSYKASGSEQGLTAWNTMTTPRGRQFQLLLPDGTKVWLNAASSISFPVAFSSHERMVKVEGEAYFEIAPDANHPFRVNVKQTTIEVLGTSFNIQAYHDETSQQTTLINGAIRVVTKAGTRQLRPGQQLRLNDDGIRITQPDVSQVIAWKNGSFGFTNASLQEVMQQLARWYDIEVKYEGNIPEATFSGEIDRSLTLDQLLKGLTRTRVHYRIEENNTLIITP